MQRLVNTADESELPGQALTVFACSSKKHVVLRYPGGILCSFCWLILDAFHWVLLSFGLTGSSTCWNWSFGFPEGAHSRGLPFNLTIYTVSPSSDENQSLVWFLVVHFACPMIYFIPLHCAISISSPITFCFKNGKFSLHLSRESQIEILSSKFFFFFCLIYVEPKYQSD